MKTQVKQVNKQQQKLYIYINNKWGFNMFQSVFYFFVKL